MNNPPKKPWGQTVAAEVADILALGFLRMRLRQWERQRKREESQNSLDDVAPSAKVLFERSSEDREGEKA
jgi:hypothetical protein